MGLYLRYRIWIAEMNADVTSLRIFDDYLEALPAASKQRLKTIAEEFKKQFVALRKEMDDLKHEMHLQKMKLAASTREHKTMDSKLYRSDNHSTLKKHYSTYRKAFNKMKSDFGMIGENWA